MPSPFPGMDPYLEGHYWTTLHSQLVPEFARQLSPQLPERYVILTDEWYALWPPDELPRRTQPDFNIGAVREAAATYEARAASPPTHIVHSPLPQRRRQVHMEVRTVGDMRLVTH